MSMTQVDHASSTRIGASLVAIRELIVRVKPKCNEPLETVPPNNRLQRTLRCAARR